jgi:hypothetical protein
LAGAPRRVGLILLVLLVGLTVASFLGELVGSSLPSGLLQTLLTRGPMVGLTTPATLDLRFLSFTLGLAVKVTLPGAFGLLVVAVVLLRRL